MDAFKLDAENAPVPKDLPELCQILHIIFAEDTVNVEYVKRIIENYKSNPKDWRKYATRDHERDKNCNGKRQGTLRYCG